MDVEQLRQLVSQPRETAKVDFKLQLYKIYEEKPPAQADIQKWVTAKDQQWAEFVKDILALTNGNIGTVQQTAYLIIGCDDKLKADGTPTIRDVGNQVSQPKEIYEKVSSYCEPQIQNLECQTISLDNQRLFVISIPPSPYIHKLSKQLKTPKKEFSRHTVLLRRSDGEETYEASDDEKKALQREKDNFFGKSSDESSQSKKAVLLTVDELVREVRDRIRPLVQERCGTMRVLDMNQPIELGKIYTHVNILEKISGRSRRELAELMQGASPEDIERFSLGEAKERIPGLEAVQKYSKLMILGKPGAGKTTFLKHLAIECIGGNLERDRVPLFITLKEFAEVDGQPDLLTFCDQLVHPTNPVGTHGRVPLPNPTATQQILDNGRALILLDGLDEVRETDVSRVLRQIQHFADHYFHNAFIITCRIAAREYTFQQFTEIEVADFDDHQIADVSTKWFQCKEDEVKGDRFLQKLKDNPPIRELASSPLLLTLLCLVFEDAGDFPANRAELYQNGVDVSMKKWDVKRNIERDQIYKKLSLKRKEDLLSQIAWRTFESGNYFFKQSEVEQYIREFIEHLPRVSTDEETLNLDSEAVLKSIEAQHGLLVERAYRIYSFSHLTFHEYFAAREAKEKAYFTALTQNLTEKRWREVILLTLGILPNANKLLTQMKETTDELLSKDDKLQKFLEWIYKKAEDCVNLDKVPYKEVACRAFYISEFNLIHSLDKQLNHDCAVNIEPTLDSEVESALFDPAEWLVDPERQWLREDEHEEIMRRYDPTWKTSQNDEISFGEITLNQHLYLDYHLLKWLEETQYEVAVVHSLSFTCKVNLKSTPFLLDPQLHQKLQTLCARFEDYCEEDLGFWEEWWKDNGQVWTGQLQSIMIEHRNIGHDWQFSDAQIEKLQQYSDANQLLVDCLNSDCYVSREVRQEIEDTLLLPIAEIEKRKSNLTTQRE